ncbi:MAG: hypothetical protein Q9204_002076 [Flavoplaca sp. TL-2023a]
MSNTASDLASGSQDLAALLGLFCTQGVERNALANNFGYGTVVASSLSLLGVLGLVKSSIKLALGLKRCEQAGFNLDSLRGIFGYLEGESPSQGTKLDCMVVKVTFGSRKILIHKENRWFSGGNTPMVNVGVGPENLHRNTLMINLGNLMEEKRLRKHAVVIISALVVSAGLTSWLLEIVQAEWNWIKVVAIPGLHACLVLLVGIPLYYDSQVNQPAKHMTLDSWDRLHFEPRQSIPGKKRSLRFRVHFKRPMSITGIERSLRLLQVDDKDNHKDILHMWGNPNFLDSYITKALLIALSVYAAIAYICQYAIIKGGALAAARLAFWILDPKFDDSAAGDSEIVSVNNTESNTLTFPELICNLDGSETSAIPWWAIHYLLTQPLKEILLAAASRTEQDTVPLDASYYVLRTLDLGRLLRRRWIDTGDDGAHMMVLALYRTTDGEITPLILIDVDYSVVRGCAISPLLKSCLAEAQWPPRVSAENVRSPCTLFALDKNYGRRLHLTSPRDEQLSIHDENCPSSNKFPEYLSPNAYKYLEDRSRVCRFLQRIARDNSFNPKFTPGWANAVHISGSNAKPFSRRGLEQPWILDYQKGIQGTRKYLARGFRSQKLERKIRFPSLRYFRGIYSRVRDHLLKRSTEEALSEDGESEVAAEMENLPPTASSV